MLVVVGLNAGTVGLNSDIVGLVGEEVGLILAAMEGAICASAWSSINMNSSSIIMAVAEVVMYAGDSSTCC